MRLTNVLWEPDLLYPLPSGLLFSQVETYPKSLLLDLRYPFLALPGICLITGIQYNYIF